MEVDPLGRARARGETQEAVKNRRLRRTKQVREDLVEIYGFLHERSPRAAERVFDAIESSIRALALGATTLGRRWESRDPRLDGIRVLVVTRYPTYLVFFRLAGDVVEIYRVLHGARELQRLIDEIELDFDDA